MPLKLDPAIIKALSLDDAVTTIASHGGSGFSSTAKITTQVDGEEKLYFVKTGTGKDAKVMFAGELLQAFYNGWILEYTTLFLVRYLSLFPVIRFNLSPA